MLIEDARCSYSGSGRLGVYLEFERMRSPYRSRRKGTGASTSATMAYMKSVHCVPMQASCWRINSGKAAPASERVKAVQARADAAQRG